MQHNNKNKTMMCNDNIEIKSKVLIKSVFNLLLVDFNLNLAKTKKNTYLLKVF